MLRRGMAVRAICYCKDCQAFASHLQRSDDVLDASGGTHIVATLPKQVQFTHGVDRLACLSLSSRGLFRWYAACCNTPIGNTPRDRRFPYIGLIEACLESVSPSMHDSFGPERLVVNTESAHGPVRKPGLGNVPALFRVMAGVIATRLNGSYRRNPFFTPDGEPVVRPTVLSRAERDRATPSGSRGPAKPPIPPAP